MRPVSDQFKAAVAGSHAMAAEAILLTSYQEGVSPSGTGLSIESGDVQLDQTAQVRSTLSLVTDGTGWDARPGRSDLQPYGSEVFARRGVNVAGSTEWVSLGYFRIQSVSQDKPPDGPLSVEASDRMQAIIDAQIVSPVSFKATDTVSGVFAALVHDVYPSATIDFDYSAASDELGTAMVTGQDRYGFLYELAASRGKIMFWDYQGHLSVQDVPSPSEAVADLTAGQPGGVTASVTNAIPAADSSFEAALTGNWVIWANITGLTQSSAQAYDGTNSLAIAITAAGTTQWIYNPQVEAVAGRRYRLTFAFNAPAAGDPADHVTAFWFTADGSANGSSDLAVNFAPGVSGWNAVTDSVIPPAGTASVQLWWTYTAAGAGTAYLDAVTWQGATTVRYGGSGVLISAARTISRDQIFNAVIATASGAVTRNPPVAAAYDVSNLSLTRWGGAFGKIPMFFSSSLLTTARQARDAARALLTRASGIPYQADFSAVPNPALEPLDAVRIRYERSSYETHVISSLTIPLTADQAMTGTTRDTSGAAITTADLTLGSGL